MTEIARKLLTYFFKFYASILNIIYLIFWFQKLKKIKKNIKKYYYLASSVCIYTEEKNNNNNGQFIPQTKLSVYFFILFEKRLRVSVIS